MTRKIEACMFTASSKLFWMAHRLPYTGTIGSTVGRGPARKIHILGEESAMATKRCLPTRFIKDPEIMTGCFFMSPTWASRPS